jgi:uncharacterized phage protein gp47/JayE
MMSQPIPTTQQLADDYIAQVDASVEQSTPFLDKAYTRVVAKVQAGMNVLLYKYASWIVLQIFVSTASMRETEILGRMVRPLVEWGRLIGVGDPIAATRAELQVAIKVQRESATPLSAGAQLIYPATGVVYVTTAPVLLDAASVVATVRASSDQQGGHGEGTIGNVLAGATLQFANPLPNVARDVAVVAQVVTGANAESEAAYRGRVIRRCQRKPQGGAVADYAVWAEEAAGITHAYVYRGAPGEVDVYVEATPESSGSEDGVPTVAQRSAVDELIQLDVAGKATRRPVGAAVNILPIRRAAFDVRVTGLEGDVSTRQSIEDALDEYLRTREPFITGLSILPRADRVTLAAVSGIVDDVASSLGGSVASVTLSFANEAIPAYTLGQGEKAKLGSIIFV